MFSAVVHVNEETGMKHYPFELESVPRLHWEDPTADHLMTHEVGQEECTLALSPPFPVAVLV